MRSLAVFLSGLAATIMGAFIRSCSESGLPSEFAHSWCGGSPLQFAVETHLHCGGCAFIVTGVGLVAASFILAYLGAPRANAAARR